MGSSIAIEKDLFRSDTALHIAVSNVQENVVEELVELISEQSQPRKALETRNEQGILLCIWRLR
ncbi:ankyrin repeat-containing protein [Corchorus capsularis]|uniref:Ankyrin repeat-containing protein n=1 Tax=Corchorus capsularis TaxID=210143 RepID=A0A1R3I4Y5_COCAP|nr:ankyrin repeat-containing protein [Corchorus capsularis]